jgi:uncharacterized protein YbjT (DUF2867 family)
MVADAEAVFVTGGTGYIGRPLIAALVAGEKTVHALARPASQAQIPPGAHRVIGDALDANTFAAAIPRGATIVHLVGTPHPGPAKAAEFISVDLASIRATTAAAVAAGAARIVYVSVAHPAPFMHAYIVARTQGEELVRATGIPATILRPWYVLGPGHYWPYLLVPFYALFRLLPATRADAVRLGLVTRAEMVAALLQAIAAPTADGPRIIDVPAIRAALAPS